jgi:hypothetical protein
MTIKISQLPSLTTVYGNVLLPVVSNIAGTWTTVRGNVSQLQTYILGTVVTDLANLTASTTANAGIQHTEIITANTAMKGYVDSQDTINSNSVTGANAAIVTANTAMKGYVDSRDTINSNSVIGANAAIVTANTAMKGYVDSQDTINSNSVTGANAAIVTANTAMKGYADAITSAWTANAGAQHDDIVSLVANAGVQHGNITVLEGNVIAINSTISGLILTLANTLTFTQTTISSNSAVGVKGDTAYDSSHIYFCVATNSWIRTARDAW